jgi:hypothetical protein
VINPKTALRGTLGLIALLPLLLGERAAAADDLPQAEPIAGDQVIPGAASDRDPTLPGDTVIPDYRVKDPELRRKLEEAKRALQKLRDDTAREAVDPPSRQPPLEPALVLPSEVKAPELQPAPLPLAEPRSKPRKKKKQAAAEPTFRDEAGGVRVFTRNLTAAKRPASDTFTLPSTSIALATLLYGIEATSTEERMVPAELNYAWLGPNDAVVEMKNCRLWIKVKGDYSTERIYGTSESLSCRAPGGETFDIPISAHMVDKEEEYLGAKGELVARGKALASALSFLSDGVGAFGSAMASAQVETEVAPSGEGGAPVKGSNVGGDKNKYIAGKTVAGSTAKFLDWWIGYYQSLAPTIAIGPGKKIYLAVHGTVEIPRIFFGARVERSQFGALTKDGNTGPGGRGVPGPPVNTTESLLKKSTLEDGE